MVEVYVTDALVGSKTTVYVEEDDKGLLMVLNGVGYAAVKPFENNSLIPGQYDWAGIMDHNLLCIVVNAYSQYLEAVK